MLLQLSTKSILVTYSIVKHGMSRYVAIRSPVMNIIVFLCTCTHTIMILQYLGVIPNLKDWQCPESRTQFLQLVDQAQVLECLISR